MILEKARLFQYRNYEAEQFEFKDQLNFILGDNAQGKTNLLEAIYHACIGKAFRTTRNRDLIKKGSDLFRLELEFLEDDRRYRFFTEADRKGRKASINNLSLQRRSELFGKFPMVLFAPDHLQMIKEGPARRRDFLDREISLLSRPYFYALVRYNKILMERSALMKDEKPNLRLLEVYEEQLNQQAQPIFEKRASFIEKLEIIASEIHREISEGQEELSLNYESSLFKEESLLEQLHRARARDLRQGNTSVGIHLDDLNVKINDVDVRRFGSQGQVRLAALSLFLALIPFIEKEIEIKPMILLDDVFSELDRRRRENLLERLNHYQCLITATDLDGFQHDSIADGHVLWIHEGRRRRNE